MTYQDPAHNALKLIMERFRLMIKIDYVRVLIKSSSHKTIKVPRGTVVVTHSD